MSNYPRWWNATITLYNKYENKETHEVSWYRKVINNCYWGTDVNSSYIDSVNANAVTSSIICRIPKSDKYVNAYTWKNSDINRSSKLTFQPEDIIIKGKITDEIDEYTKGSHSTDLLNKYKDLGAIRINLITDNSSDEKPIKHYAIR